MDKHRFRPRESRWMPTHPEDRVQYFLDAEERILRSIAGRTPVPEILNGICTALDCQIGNMVSLISVPDDVASVVEMARNASLFGLHIFFSRNIFAESGEELGSLEMFSSIARDPLPNELLLIERAVCLAAIALGCDKKPKDQSNYRVPGEAPARAHPLRWSALVN